MSEKSQWLSEAEQRDWQWRLRVANHNNIFCHCHACGREWVDSTDDAGCICGSDRVERIACWQFPDD